MPLTSIKEIRKQQLLQAAFEIIKRDGLRAATLSLIAKEAGASKGIVHHYFENKRSLIELTMRYAHAARSAELVKRLRKAQSPSQRIWAVLSVILDDQYLQSGFCKVWISFKAQAFSDPELGRLHRAIHRREFSNLMHAFLPFLPRQEAVDLALGVKALVEGYRFRLAAVPPQNFGTRVPFEQVLAYVARRIPDFDLSVAHSR
jgi:TetR/AcrR family transcriptional repressor of bet genes